MIKRFQLFLFFIFTLNAAEPCKLLVTGCGRSGTNYMAEVLYHAGYDIKHEKYGADGCVSWPMAVNSYSPWGPMSNEHFEHIFHQVRNPLNVINSWIVNLDDLSRDEWKFIRNHIPQIQPTDSLIVSAAKYWIYWNQLAEARAEWRYKIEEFKDNLPEFVERSGLILDAEQIDKISTSYNSWKKITAKLTWSMLKEELPQDVYEELEALALKYGYSVTDL